MILDPEMERLRFLMTATELPDFKTSTVGCTDEEINATVDEVVKLVFAAVCATQRAPSDVRLLPPLVLDEMNYMYFKTMAKVGDDVELEKFASPEGSEYQAKYREAHTNFTKACTKILQDYVAEDIPADANEAVTKAARKMLLNRHLWMTHGPTCKRLWAASDMYPYMLKGPLFCLNNMLAKSGAALTWVRCEKSYEDNVPNFKCELFSSGPAWSIRLASSTSAAVKANISPLEPWTGRLTSTQRRTRRTVV